MVIVPPVAWRRRRLCAVLLTVAAASWTAAPAAEPTAEPTAGPAANPRPDILLVTVDTLRADRLSAYGYARPTSPNLDRLFAEGVRFDQARTIEPLTAPSLCSLLTSLHPHEHGTSRNGLRMRPGLSSLPLRLSEEGYVTAAFVGNWTLRDKISGLGRHFEHYEEVLKRKRWFGLASSEANAEDVSLAALTWLRGRHRTASPEPVLLWVHYVEPHAPYRMQERHRAALGLPDKKKLPPSDRYDTEVAEIDRAVGEFLTAARELLPRSEPLVVFASDHGESLGEHDYWGHGRHLYEVTLRVPMALSWPGRLKPRRIGEPALTIDLAPTVLSLLELEAQQEFRGFDWTPVLQGRATAPADRKTSYQAHRGAVLSRHDSDLLRRAGLLSVAVIENGIKEVFRIESRQGQRFDLRQDPGEITDLSAPRADPTTGLQDWMRMVYHGLHSLDDSPVEPLDDESIEQLRSLGYAD